MSFTRRSFLATSALLGNAALSHHALGLPYRDRPTALLVLCSGTPFDASFFAGAVAGCRSLGGPVPRKWDVDLAHADSFERLRKEFSRLHNVTVIGLLEAAPALLVEQALLERRATITQTGDHVGGGMDIEGADWPYRLGHHLASAAPPATGPSRIASVARPFNLASFTARL